MTILRRYRVLLIIFLSFASGGLMADVFLRLLPRMISSKNSVEIHNQVDNRAGLVILTSIFLSFFSRKILSIRAE